MLGNNLLIVCLVRPDGQEAVFTFRQPTTPLAILGAAGISPAGHTLRTLDGNPIDMTGNLPVNLPTGPDGVRLAVWPKLVAG